MSYRQSRAAQRRQRVMQQQHPSGQEKDEFVPTRKCQKCFQTDHWTYECKLKSSVYQQKESATNELKKFSYVIIYVVYPCANINIAQLHYIN